MSCEACAPGYTRQESGAWLGRCIRDEEPCRPGTYGDPYRKIPCKVSVLENKFLNRNQRQTVVQKMLLFTTKIKISHQILFLSLAMPMPINKQWK